MYTQIFAQQYMRPEQCDTFPVPRAHFNYETCSWATRSYYLPKLRDDFVLLTPMDMLTRDDTWISYQDMVTKFWRLPEAVSNEEQRGKINYYIIQKLGQKPNAKELRKAVVATITEFPELIDLYIRLQEDDGDRAENVSINKVEETYRSLVAQLRTALADLASRTEFYSKPWSSYQECLDRVMYFKEYIENNDGYLLFNRAGKPFSNEKELQLAFGLVWCGTEFDLNREVNNGRGPVDFKASYGAGDKSLIEFKLGGNTALKKNLQKQVAIYEAANRTRTSVKVIVIYNAQQDMRVRKTLQELKLEHEESIVIIDARNDNKASGSKAK